MSAEINRTRLPPLLAGHRLRNLFARYRDTLGLFQRLHREYGPMARYRILSLEFILLSDPELIEEVLYAKRQSFEKGFMYKRSLLLPRPTVITGDGEDHKRRRRLVQPYFHRRMLDANASIMARHAAAMRDGWKDGEILDMDGTAHELALSISLEIFFGNGHSDDSDHPFQAKRSPIPEDSDHLGGERRSIGALGWGYGVEV